MTRARAPLRLGLAGGGTDLSPYSDLYGGATLNITINRFAFASIEPRNDGRIEFRADDLEHHEVFELEDDLSSATLLLHRGVYERMVAEFGGGIRFSATIQTNVEAPAGSGLGSSSALVVALVDAFRNHLNAPLGQYDVAHLAYEIERLDLGLAGGKQDQYAAAFGGVNFIEFLGHDRVIVNPLRIPRDILNELESRLVTCFSGTSRHSADIIQRQTTSVHNSDPIAVEAMHSLKSDCLEMKRTLMRGDFDAMAEILYRSWLAKKATASTVSSAHLEDMLAFAAKHGAQAGKVSGAGGGGFMFFLVDPTRRYGLMTALRQAWGNADPVVFSETGCQSWRVPCRR
ncbi:MAG: dehydrogenase [Dechloromonas sp.]|nr:MAG: dehydrogenase [Dechloromonas sp.]